MTKLDAARSTFLARSQQLARLEAGRFAAALKGDPVELREHDRAIVIARHAKSEALDELVALRPLRRGASWSGCKPTCSR